MYYNIKFVNKIHRFVIVTKSARITKIKENEKGDKLTQNLGIKSFE